MAEPEETDPPLTSWKSHWNPKLNIDATRHAKGNRGGKNVTWARKAKQAAARGQWAKTAEVRQKTSEPKSRALHPDVLAWAAPRPRPAPEVSQAAPPFPPPPLHSPPPVPLHRLPTPAPEDGPLEFSKSAAARKAAAAETPAPPSPISVSSASSASAASPLAPPPPPPKNEAPPPETAPPPKLNRARGAPKPRIHPPPSAPQENQIVDREAPFYGGQPRPMVESDDETKHIPQGLTEQTDIVRWRENGAYKFGNHDLSNIWPPPVPKGSCDESVLRTHVAVLDSRRGLGHGSLPFLARGPEGQAPYVHVWGIPTSGTQVFQKILSEAFPEVRQSGNPCSMRPALLHVGNSRPEWKHAVPINPNLGHTHHGRPNLESGTPQIHVFCVRGLCSWLVAQTRHKWLKVRDDPRVPYSRRQARSVQELMRGPVFLRYLPGSAEAGDAEHQYRNAIQVWLMYMSGYARGFISTYDERWIPRVFIVRWEDLVNFQVELVQWLADAGLPSKPRPFIHRIPEEAVSPSGRTRTEVRHEAARNPEEFGPVEREVLMGHVHNYWELFNRLGYMVERRYVLDPV